MIHRIGWASAFLCLTVSTVPCYADLITFETIPGGTPSEGLEISDQFLATEGVSFRLEGGGFPLLAAVGLPRTAFFGPPDSTGADNPEAGQGVGSYFLTDDGLLGSTAVPLIISYSSPTAAASGVILDIDFNERFTIQIRDAAENILETISIEAGDANTGDGIATPWSFDRGVNEVQSIRLEGTRTDGQAFGLAFDNFNAHSAVPEPSGLALLTLGAVGLLGYGWRRRVRNQRARD